MTFFQFVLAAVLMSALPAHGADRIIYLTFDDGPLNGTSNILDVLEAEQVPATLFMVGMHAEAGASNKALVRRAKAMPLVTIGNHSYSHAYNHYRHFYGNTEGVVADMLKRCEKGPADARVTKVTITKEGGLVPPGFNVRATDGWR